MICIWERRQPLRWFCAKDRAGLTLNGLARVYDGAAKTVTATTVPSGLGVDITYDSSYIVPSNAGSYNVVGAVQDHRYYGGSTGTLVIARGIDTITFSATNQVYDWGAPRFVVSNSAHEQPVQMTYNGSATVPTNVGIYAVTGLVDAANWAGTNTTELIVAKATQTIYFASIPNQFLTNETLLEANASSLLTVRFAVEEGPAVLEYRTNRTYMTYTNVGWVAISCVQTGDLNWAAALPVTNRFEVLAIPGIANPTVSSAMAETATLGATITATNGTPVLTRGVVWATNGSVEVSTGIRVFESGTFGTGVYTLSVTGLPPATLISMRGYAINNAGTNATAVTNFWTLPVAPTGLTETNVLDRQFESQWGAVYGATNYLLDVAYDAQFSNSVPGFALRAVETDVSVTVTSILRGAECFWRVRAENQGGLSLWSVTNSIDLPQAQLDVLGTNGLPFADGQAASVQYGTDYGFVPTNQLWSRTFQIRNSGTYPMAVSNITVSGADVFSVSNVPAMVDVGATSNFLVNFAPTAVQGYSSSVHVVAGAVETSLTFSVQGAGQAQAFTNVLTKIESSFTDWTLRPWQGLLQGTLQICNEESSEDRYVGPFYFAVRAVPNTYGLVDPDGVDSEGRDYIDITTQVTAQVGTEGLSPGQCVSISNILMYSYNLQIPQNPR